jgi:hypothetical protein
MQPHPFLSKPLIEQLSGERTSAARRPGPRRARRFARRARCEPRTSDRLAIP